MKLGFEIRDNQGLQTALNRRRDSTGSLASISTTNSSGRLKLDIPNRVKVFHESVNLKRNGVAES